MADVIAIGARASPCARELEPLLLDALHAQGYSQGWVDVYRAVQDALRFFAAGSDEARLRLTLFLHENNDLAVSA